MILISLLIALAAERVLLSPLWHFNYYYARYINFILGFVSKDEISRSRLNITALALIPAAIVWGVMAVIDIEIISFIVSTLILVVCFGCGFSRDAYKNFLNAAMRGDEVAVTHHQMELQQDQAYESESFGQTLVWLNYQYYMAIMLIFIFFGISAVVFYRVLIALSNNVAITDASTNEVKSDAASEELSADDGESETVDDIDADQAISKQAVDKSRNILFYIDFIPSRFSAFGYMLVGHFSKASTLWLEGLLNYTMSPRKYLCEVAKTSEDCIVDQEDLTSEPTLLVRLAKRNVLLLLAATAFMTIAGVLS
ncbi:regulatory signaling modulator protein AmpE [Thalassomonas sp. M1454]|uniref:regulatory signaling modulator protein AmpE n=1 Tax=Thalassomonas sp. M1454 TaxID=2594477 RepID=UPI00117D08AC|nr:regulatory signaling modulator protein AmpE [Thalassomonas sp. M1454]TRX52696.1 regulatory signaling modulator protein AmpE [Thalassomonas sp. M1454]